MIDLSHLAGETVVVFGLGQTGQATATALKAAGAHVLVGDDNPEKAQLAADQGWQFEGLTQIDWRDVARFVLSPGVPPSHPVIQAAEDSRVAPCSDFDLLYEACPKATYIGITGTNGKSTTTALIGHILRRAGHKVEVGGNIGEPALALTPFEKSGTYVLEASSYQLAVSRQVAFNQAILLNLSSDHLDYHGSLEAYVAAKLRIFDRQPENAQAVVGLDDMLSQKIYDGLLSQNQQTVFPISTSVSAPGGVFCNESGQLIDDLEQTGTMVAEVADLNPGLRGAHNWQNICAAYTVARLHGVAPQTILKHIATFEGLAHRQELVEELVDQSGFLTFINDSKATNPASAARALATYQNVYWIAGGQAKEEHLDDIKPVKDHIRHAFLIGECADMFAGLLEKMAVPHTVTGTLDAAVEQATAMAHKDSLEEATVLLSPAAASWDQFKNFEDRGDQFRALAQKRIHNLQAK